VIELALTGGKAVEAGLRRLQARTTQLGRGFLRIGTLGVAGGGGFATLRNLFVGSAATAALAWPVKLAANIELLTEQMAVFTGSSESANAVLLDLQKFTAVGFQSLEDLVQQTRLLMTRGIEPDQALRDIKALATLAAGSVEEFQQLTKAFADVRSSTRLNGEEMRQFKNTAFNPFVEIAKQTGETFDELRLRMEAGGISFEEVAFALHASTAAGGRFHGMLDRISATLTGQLRAAIANFKIAILPLGQELLAPFTELFRLLNRTMPRIAEFIKANASVVRKVLALGAVLSIAATGFITVGLGLTLATIAAGGFVTTLGLAFGALKLAVAIALVGRFTGGFEMLRTSAGNFANVLRDRVVPQINMIGKGLRDAVFAGDFGLAGRIITATFNAAWVSVKANALKTWIDIKYSIMGAMIDVQHFLSKLWGDVWAQFEKLAMNAVLSVLRTLSQLPFVGQKFTSALKILSGLNAVRNLSGPGAEDRRMQAILASYLDAISALAAKKASELQSSLPNVAAAFRELKAAIDAAGEAAKKAAENEKLRALEGKWLEHLFGQQLFPGGAPGQAGLALARNQQQALFDTTFARQIFGTQRSREEIELWKKIEKNTRPKKNAGGVPVGP
jgi:tape measure domain-containing protein